MGRGLAKGIISGIAGGIIFVLFLFVLNFGILISVLAGVAVYAGITLVTSKTGGAAKSAKDIISDMSREVKCKIEKVQSLALNIRNSQVRQDLIYITEIIEDIIRDYERNPRELTPFTNINYYLDSINNIVSKYNELAGQGIKTEQVNNALVKVEDAIKSFKDSLIKELGKIHENDIIDLEAEIDVLNKSIKTEGLQ